MKRVRPRYNRRHFNQNAPPQNLGFIGAIIGVAMSAIKMGVSAATAGGPDIVYPKFEMSIFLPKHLIKEFGGVWKEEKKYNRTLSSAGAYVVTTVEAVLNSFTCGAAAVSGIGGACLPSYGGIVIYGLTGGKGSALKMIDDLRNLNIGILTVYQGFLQQLPYETADSILKTEITIPAIKAANPKKFMNPEDLGDYVAGLIRIPLLKKKKDAGFATYEFYDEILKIINKAFEDHGIELGTGQLGEPIVLTKKGSPTVAPTIHNTNDLLEDEIENRINNQVQHLDFSVANQVDAKPPKPMGAMFLDPVIQSPFVQDELRKEQTPPIVTDKLTLVRKPMEVDPIRGEEVIQTTAVTTGETVEETSLVNSPMFMLTLAVAPILVSKLMGD